MEEKLKMHLVISQGVVPQQLFLEIEMEI